MSRFKIGQKVVYTPDGRVVTVDGFSACENCGKPTLYIKGYTDYGYITCGSSNGSKGCGHRTFKTYRANYDECHFAPLQNNGDAIEYRLSVSEPEMEALKLKGVQHQ